MGGDEGGDSGDDASSSSFISLRPGHKGGIIQGGGEAVGGGVYGVDYVTATSLSHVVREDVDLLRINAEDGAEGAVIISGGRRLICNFRVKHILMEFNNNTNTAVAAATTTATTTPAEEGGEQSRREEEFQAMLHFLHSAGYTTTTTTPASFLTNADTPDVPPPASSTIALLFELQGGERARC